jgi:hypothetical protein
MGKSTLLYVLGLSFIISLALISMSSTGTDSMDNYSSYYYRTTAHNIATAGANVATQLCLFNQKPTSNVLAGKYFGGTYRVTIDSTRDSTVIVSAGRISNAMDVTVDTVKAILKYTRFSKYGYFSQTELNQFLDSTGVTPSTGGYTYGGSVQFISGDSLFGPVHTNSRFAMTDRPYFNDKVTAANAPTLSGSRNPIYHGGYEWGVTVGRPNYNMDSIKVYMNNGLSGAIRSQMASNDIALAFNSNGTVRLRIPPSGTAIRDTTMPLSAFGSSGVIGSDSSNVHISGTYHGQITVAAFKGKAGARVNKGNVWIDNDVVAATSPVNNMASPDMLGIVAERDTYIHPGLGDLSIQATIYCHTGEFTLYKFREGGPQGRLYLYGGVTQYSRGGMGTFSGSTITNGYKKSYRFDPRFTIASPPHFPSSDKLELVTWWEN